MKKYALLSLVVFFLACDGSTPVEPPEKEISPEMMEDIFYDLSLMKAIKNSRYEESENKDYFIAQYIFQKYDIDSLQLKQNEIYYAQKPKLMKKIFQNLKLRTQLALDSIDTIIKRGEIKKVKVVK
jgi:hypothetical protein